MTRVLLLDASFAARPIRSWLDAQGLDVRTIGNRSSDLLAQTSVDRHFLENYGHVASVQNIIEHYNIDYVVPGCTDVSMHTALNLSFRNSAFDSIASGRALTNKSDFRKLCCKLGINAPSVVKPEGLPKHAKLIAKPTNSFSGRGISVFDGRDAEAAREALSTARAASATGQAIVEQFVEGSLYSYSAFFENESVTEAVVVREGSSANPYLVDTSYVVPNFPEDVEGAIRSDVEKMARDLGLVDGLFHLQFIWDHERTWFIECSRRCPGDLYPSLIELSTGLPYAGLYASSFVRRPLRIDRLHTASRFILRHTVTADNETYEGLWSKTAGTLVEFHALQPVGGNNSVLAPAARVALLFLEYDSLDELERAFDQYSSRKAYATASPK